MDTELTKIRKAKRSAAQKAVALNKALNNDTVTLKSGNIIKIDSKGNETILSKSTFSFVKATKRKYSIKSAE